MVNQVKIELLHELLKKNRFGLSKDALLERLECSESTLKRAISTLRNQYEAEINYDRDSRRYSYSDEKYELNLPSLWANPETLLALLSMQQLLSNLKLDFLDQHLQALKHHIEKYLKQHHQNLIHLSRVRLLPINNRIYNQVHFQTITTALIQRQCLHIQYFARGSNQTSQRQISPQRLARYKDNWYLDAWCHLRNQLRTFALDRIKEVENTFERSNDVSEVELDRYLASGYGIFAGEAKQTATLLFSANRARWVADETWHPNQKKHMV